MAKKGSSSLGDALGIGIKQEKNQKNDIAVFTETKDLSTETIIPNNIFEKRESSINATILIPKDLHQKLKLIAVQNSSLLSDLIANVLEQFVKQYKIKNK